MSHVNHTKPVIIIGFGVILTLSATLSGIWLVNVKDNNQRLTALVEAQKVSELIFIMRDAAHKRALALHRLAIMEDPFERDAEYMYFHAKAENFIKASDELANHPLSEEQTKAWEVAKPLIRQGAASQNKALALFMDGNTVEANRLLLQSVIPIQNSVMQHLTTMLELQKSLAADELRKTTRQNQAVFLMVSVLGAMAVLLGILIAYFVIKTSSRSERDLVLAWEEAQRANRHKSIFLANMSHELRTPLNAIIGYSEIIQDESQHIEDKSLLTDVSKIHKAGHHLLALINEILDLAKIEAGKMELFPETFNLIPLIQDVTYTIQPLLEQSKNTLEISIGALNDAMHNDLIKVRQSLFNLLSNACKFTKQGVITVEVSDFESDCAGWIKIAIKDTGIGISNEHLKNIFSPFAQADTSTTRNYGGTGLGLTISKHYCQMMGGDLGVQSEPGSGSIFTMTLLKCIDEKEITPLKKQPRSGS